jgi:metallo-beta-lactamase class B
MRKAIETRVLVLATTLVFGMASHVPGQDRETLAKHPKLFIETAATLFGWNDPAEPMKIVGPISFVGTKGLGVWLIRTSEGHILLNTGMASSGPMIEASIRKLGLQREDVKLLLTCHAHIDHVGGHAYLWVVRQLGW